jgi:peptidoglycan/xylan/chitin deacetylase (PgdA/CDA1 family)
LAGYSIAPVGAQLGSVLTRPAAKEIGRLLHQFESGRDIVRKLRFFICAVMFACTSVPAFAMQCPGNPDALGTSRVLAIDPYKISHVGSMQYKQTLPLNDHEVVITFDDSPLPPYTDAVLKILASQCVQVNYFLIGKMARAYPYLVRRIYNAGHTVGTHTLDHPLGLKRLPLALVEHEVDGGVAAVETAMGDAKAVAPFFRIPGLSRSDAVDSFLASQSLVTWSADVVADDWFRRITPQQIVKRAMQRLEAKGRGILLLHDIHPATALALPSLLMELKQHGYKVVHVVPTGELPKSVPELPVPASAASGAWPRVLHTNATSDRNAIVISHHQVKKRAVGKIY